MSDAHTMASEEIALANDGRAMFRAWHVPQVPMKAFQVDAPTFQAATIIIDVLAAYDLFQFENNIKPDYCNMGAVQWNHPVLTEGDWHDLDDDGAEYFGFTS